MNIHSEKSDGRAATRARLVQIFNQLLLEGDIPRPKVARIVEEAGISRSTFYDHFDGVEALLDESVTGLLSQLADSLVDPGDGEQLDWLFDHLWENRALGREILTGQRGERAEALLARQIEERLPKGTDSKLLAILAAGTVMAATGSWVTGRVSRSPEQLASQIRQTVSAIFTANN